MMQTASSFEIARLAGLQSASESQFTLLITDRQDPDNIGDLIVELSIQLGEDAARIVAAGVSLEDLINELHQAQSSAIVIEGLEDWTDQLFIQLDVNRTRLETGKFMVFTIDLANSTRLLRLAPNLRSYFGTHVFLAAPDPSLMSSDQIDHRLGQLRAHYTMSDEQMIERVARNELPSEPEIIEWLVLLGRSELVG